MVEVGYENSSHFHRLFKDTYGMTPKEDRRRYTMSEWPMFEEQKKNP